MANAVYAKVMSQFSVRSQHVLINAQCPHIWWSTLKTAVFGSSLQGSSLAQFVSSSSYWEEGGVIWSVSQLGRAEMLSANFEKKAVQGSCRSAIPLPTISLSHYLCLQVMGGEATPVGFGF